MLFVDHNKIEDFIIEVLHETPLSGPELIKKIQENRGNITKQAIYHVLKFLVKQEVVHKTKGKYYLNIFWLRKIESFLMSYVKRNPENLGITHFKDKDNVTVTFKNIDSMDIYWGHLFDTIYTMLPKNKILFLSNPHEWIMIVREKTERFFFDRCEKEKRLHLVAIGGNTPLDKKFKREFHKEYNKINIAIDMKIKNNKYLSIAGDYIFEITITQDMADEIERIYQDKKISEQKVYLSLKKLIKKPSKTKLRIIKNKKKADILKKRIAKDFYIPDEFIL